MFKVLETRTEDGKENPGTTIQSSKFKECQPVLTNTRHVNTHWVVLASKKWWDTLSPDEQKLIRQAAVASRDFERKDSRADSKKAMDTLKEHGMKINVVSDEEIARMRQKVQPVVDKRSEEHTSELQSLMRISYAVFCLKK